jgi:hypothetical protein
MHSVKKVVRVIPVPQGYEGQEEGASIPQDDTCSVISDAADYPEEQSDVEYISEYEMEESSEESTDTETETENIVYKSMESVLKLEDDFAEINF